MKRKKHVDDDEHSCSKNTHECVFDGLHLKMKKSQRHKLLCQKECDSTPTSAASSKKQWFACAETFEQWSDIDSICDDGSTKKTTTKLSEPMEIIRNHANLVSNDFVLALLMMPSLQQQEVIAMMIAAIACC